MTTNFPASLDTTTLLHNDVTDDTVTAGHHAPLHNNISDAILAIETELGTTPKGSFASVKARLDAAATLTPAANQVFQPTTDATPLIAKLHNNLDISNLLEAQNATGTVLAYISRTGGLSAASLAIAGTALNSTHLSDSGALARLNNPTFTGSVNAPTPADGDSSTLVATTAFVASNGVPTAAVIAYAGSSAPTGWLLCDGSAISRTTYAALFAKIGTTYGTGDGSTTFNLPDLRGRKVVGKGTNADVSTLGANDSLSVGSRTYKHYHGVGTLAVGTTGSGHGHAHTLAISASGSHSHSGSGSTDGVGDHSHSYGNFPSGVGLASGYSFAGSATAWTNGSINGGGAGTGGAGAHSHGVSLSIGANTHTHVNGDFTGAVGGSDGTHTHNVSGNIGTTAGVSETGAFLVLNYIIKI